MQITYRKTFNINFAAACNFYLAVFLDDYGRDGNGTFDKEDLERFLQETTIGSFLVDVEQRLEEEIEMGDTPIEEIDCLIHFKDANEQDGYLEIYTHISELFFSK